MSNLYKLCKFRKDSIAKALHQTIENYFSEEELAHQIHLDISKLCFLYANLGADVCTHIYRQVSQKQDLYYSSVGGSLSLRISPDSSKTDKAVNFGANNLSLETGNFHLWVVGLCKDGQLLSNSDFEFIDFTAKYYKKNALEQWDIWERDDISDYLWIDAQEMKKYGVSVAQNDSISQQGNQQWLDFPQRKKFLLETIKTYLEIISSIPSDEL